MTIDRPVSKYSSVARFRSAAASAVERVLQAAITGELTIDTRSVPLADVEAVWNADGRGIRAVLVPNG